MPSSVVLVRKKVQTRLLGLRTEAQIQVMDLACKERAGAQQQQQRQIM